MAAPARGTMPGWAISSSDRTTHAPMMSGPSSPLTWRSPSSRARPEDVHALDVDGLVSPDVSFFSARDSGGLLLGIGALRWLGDDHVEVKSMHTARSSRGQGVARALLDHLLAEARACGRLRVSLETGTQDAFAPARALYTSAGFRPCEPFGEYFVSPHSVCMTLALPGGS